MTSDALVKTRHPQIDDHTDHDKNNYLLKISLRAFLNLLHLEPTS